MREQLSETVLRLLIEQPAQTPEGLAEVIVDAILEVQETEATRARLLEAAADEEARAEEGGVDRIETTDEFPQIPRPRINPETLGSIKVPKVTAAEFVEDAESNEEGEIDVVISSEAEEEAVLERVLGQQRLRIEELLEMPAPAVGLLIETAIRERLGRAGKTLSALEVLELAAVGIYHELRQLAETGLRVHSL